MLRGDHPCLEVPGEQRPGHAGRGEAEVREPWGGGRCAALIVGNAQGDVEVTFFFETKN